MACIDADGHVMEPDELFERYAPSNMSVRWRGVTDVSVNRINIVDRPDFDEWMLADEPDADRYASARAVSTIEMLDHEGFTAAALYPSKFLYLPFANGVGADVAYPLARDVQRMARGLLLARPAEAPVAEGNFALGSMSLGTVSRLS